MPPGVSDPRDTPAMRQYARFKQRHPDCLLLFRIGDFYEMFDDDAVKASKAIGLTLTQRTAGIPMAGVPYHQIENYLRKFIAAGFRVAVCEQTQDAAEAKGIVERAVTRVLTPGTLVDETLLEDDRANYIAAVCFPPMKGAPTGGKHGTSGTHPATPAGPATEIACVGVAELSTGEFTVLSCTGPTLIDELARRRVTELLYPETADGKPPPRIMAVLGALGIHGTPQPQWHFRQSEAVTAVREQYGVASLAGFGFTDDDPLMSAAGALIRYLKATQSPDGAQAKGPGGQTAGDKSLSHLQPPKREALGEHLLLEASTLRSLEVDRTIRVTGPSGTADGSLLGVFGGGAGKGSCRTPMGKRLLRDWLCRPSARLDEIRRRHKIVGALVADRRLAGELAGALAGVQDVPRIAARIALTRATPRDLVALGQSLARCALVENSTGGTPALAEAQRRLASVREALEPIASAINEACVEEPPTHLRDGGLIKDGFDAALDEARTLRTKAGDWCAAYQQDLIKKHDLPSLRVGYNKIFGYFIELPKAQAARAPAEFSRRQTLTSAERYNTPELKEFEDKVTTATSRAVQREQDLFAQLCTRASKASGPLAAYSDTLAELDVLLAFADKAAARRWVCPEMVDEPILQIVQGRHPVLDELLGSNFVPNDVQLGGGATPTLALITGPNMAGKSTFIRQTALLTLLAHAGSFVPAESARIGLTDRIFTRVGADDALHAGQSTFMVEMTETAGILHHATTRSVVVLDEIGRGTSTLDGLSLAWAIAETLAAPGSGSPAESTGPARKGAAQETPSPRTLFATHYHELTQLEENFPGRVTNLHVSVKEWGDQIVFLHRILPGRTDRSYGVHVAKLAGIPERTIRRAREILASLSVEHQGIGATPSPAGGKTRPTPAPPTDGQLALFKEYLPHPAVDALKEVKLESLTPIQAFDELRRLKGLTAEQE